MPQQPQAQPSPTPPKKKKIRVPRVVNGIEQMVEIEVDDVAGAVERQGHRSGLILVVVERHRDRDLDPRPGLGRHVLGDDPGGSAAPGPRQEPIRSFARAHGDTTASNDGITWSVPASSG